MLSWVDLDMVDAGSNRCQWNELPNPDPLSAWTRSTAKGELAMTSSTNWMVVLVAAGVGAQHPESGAVIDRGDL